MRSDSLSHLVAVFGYILLACSVQAQTQVTPPLRLQSTINLGEVRGNFDHLTYDSSSQRLFIAAKDNGSVEIVSLSGGRIASIVGFVAPHTILAQPGKPILVTDSGKNASSMLDNASLKKLRSIPLALGANCLLFDESQQGIYVTAGGDRVTQTSSTLQLVDAKDARVLRSVEVAALHLQPMALDLSTRRLFVSIADQDSIAIFDADTLQRKGTWKLPEGHGPSPIVFDGRNRRVFVVASESNLLLELDSDTGALLASASTPVGPDDMSLSTATGTLYVPGDGALAVYDVAKRSIIHALGTVSTGNGATTGTLLEPDGRYAVVVPASAAGAARVLLFTRAESR